MSCHSLPNEHRADLEPVTDRPVWPERLHRHDREPETGAPAGDFEAMTVVGKGD
jgi:hypothetical protein